MQLKNELDILSIIRQDKWMMDILRAAKQLDLPDWWVCAGFVRSKIWDTLHHFNRRTPPPDIDVIYFDDRNINESVEKDWEAYLADIIPHIPWSVKNQARMHLANNTQPYSSSTDAMSKFPETATALGVKLNNADNLMLAAPHGVDDVIHLRVRPTDHFAASKERMVIYKDRMRNKHWKRIWNNLEIDQS
ncbi:MAG TPA: nucleotidyltransferase family protein [Bacillota bacterium]|nr:nucleotidyltransferase family protein [Bacillota bacterium]